MRKNEGDFVEKTFTSLFDMNFVRVNCGDVFLEKLKGVVDPEQKRKIIGTEFFNVFWNEIRKQDELGYFAQGTIYPDCIESGKGDADVIKTHHNRVNTPDDVEFLGIIEPLADLFKDEVRAVGEKLGIPKQLVWRQPFPGPGLGVRIIGEITADKIKVLQDADWVLRDEMAKNGYEKNLAQFFCVLPCVKTVGVMGDHRTYDHLVAIRAVTTDDFMTADWARIPYEVLDKISTRIVNEVQGINRICYDKKCEPPQEIERGEIVGGFAHAQVLALADKIVEAVQSGAIKKFVVMAGCDGRAKSREYYTEFAKALPQDAVILTAGCAKYKYNKLNLGDIGGIPRVLDAGQCNDSYSLAVIALKLKEVFGLEDINQLPIIYNIAWYEQKAVIVLLALLYLGVKNIHLGPTLPAFLSPNVAKVLVDNFGIAGIGTVEEDMALFFGENN